jgi:hypothetical protein
MNGKLEIDQKGNLKMNQGVLYGNEMFRDKVVLKVGQTEIKVEKNWEKAPVTILITPSYFTAFSIADVTEKGFTIKLEKSSEKEEYIYWLALW